MKERFAPFLALLEARYAPLLFAVAPQSYAVYQWLWLGSDDTTAAFWFAVIGALGYEFIYVGAIAWAEEGRFNRWTWATAISALIFSVAVAIYVHRAQGLASLLHAGFPVVAFFYTMAFHGRGVNVAILQERESEVQELRIEIPAPPALPSLVDDLQEDEKEAQEGIEEDAIDVQESVTLESLLSHLGKSRQEAIAMMKKYGLWNGTPERAYQMIKRFVGLPDNITSEVFAQLFAELRADLQKDESDLQKPDGVSPTAWEAWQAVQNGKSQSEVAEGIGKSVSTVSRYCSKVEEALAA